MDSLILSCFAVFAFLSFAVYYVFVLVVPAPRLRTRRIGAEWGLELASDLVSIHGLDIEEEIVRAMTAEINEELGCDIHPATQESLSWRQYYNPGSRSQQDFR